MMRIAFVILLFNVIPSFAQFIPIIRANVVDNFINEPIAFVPVVVLNSHPSLSATTDSLGNFILSAIPIGRYDLQVTCAGYQPSTNSGQLQQFNAVALPWTKELTYDKNVLGAGISLQTENEDKGIAGQTLTLKVFLNGQLKDTKPGGTESSTPTDEALANGFTFEIWRAGGSLAAGKYDVRAEEDMYAVYYIQSKNGTIEYDATWANDAFIVKINVVSKTNIKGSFSGILRNELGQTISITEGAFHLPNEVIINP